MKEEEEKIELIRTIMTFMVTDIEKRNNKESSIVDALVRKFDYLYNCENNTLKLIYKVLKEKKQ